MKILRKDTICHTFLGKYCDKKWQTKSTRQRNGNGFSCLKKWVPVLQYFWSHILVTNFLQPRLSMLPYGGLHTTLANPRTRTWKRLAVHLEGVHVTKKRAHGFTNRHALKKMVHTNEQIYRHINNHTDMWIWTYVDNILQRPHDLHISISTWIFVYLLARAEGNRFGYIEYKHI